jgi:hypothetical protein
VRELGLEAIDSALWVVAVHIHVQVVGLEAA